MSATAEAVAKLSLDATGFDKQANASFREFSKQLTSVKDATDVAMRGAEALQKVFVKSLGGTLVTGAAYALSDAMRDVGVKMSASGQQAMDAQSGIKGLASSFQEAAARAEKFNAAAQNVSKTIDEINTNMLQKAVYSAANLYDKMFQGGSGNILGDLEQSLRGAAEAELMGGSINAANRAKAIANMSPEQVRAYDLQQSRNAEMAAARRLSPDFRERTIKSLQDRYAAEDAATSRAAQNAADVAAAKSELAVMNAGISGSAAAEKIGAKFDEQRAAYKASEAERIKRLNEERARMAAEDQNLNTMQIIQAQEALLTAEDQKRQIDKRVIETDAAASKIAQGIFGSARGAGQRMTSVEVGINRAVERAYNQQTLSSSKEFRDKIKQELGPGADGYAVNRELQRRQEAAARERAKETFDAAAQAKDQQGKILEYMSHVRDVLNELKAYAHVS